MSMEIYSERAALYDLIYHWKNYGREAERVRSLLLDEGVIDGARVVEAACGTGQYLVALAPWYRVSGYDLNPGMVEVARSKGCSAQVADMREHRPEVADAIVCLFSSIGYVAPQDLPAVAACWHASLQPGGVVLVEPWISPEMAQPGHMNVHTYESDDLRLVRAAVHHLDGPVSVLDFHWLVLRPTGIEHFVDAHRLHLSTREELLGPFEQAGFDARWEEDGLMPGRGLIILRKR